jgi:hypothetical protein
VEIFFIFPYGYLVTTSFRSKVIKNEYDRKRKEILKLQLIEIKERTSPLVSITEGIPN